MSNLITKAANYDTYCSMAFYESNSLPLLSYVLGELEQVESVIVEKISGYQTKVPTLVLTRAKIYK